MNYYFKVIWINFPVYCLVFQMLQVTLSYQHNSTGNFVL